MNRKTFIQVKNSIIAKWFRVNAIVIYPFIFFAPKNPDDVLVNHELIHADQIRKVGVARFYLRYIKEYLSGRMTGLSHLEAYRNISFEREAFENQKNLAYREKDNQRNV